MWLEAHGTRGRPGGHGPTGRRSCRAIGLPLAARSRTCTRAGRDDAGQDALRNSPSYRSGHGRRPAGPVHGVESLRGLSRVELHVSLCRFGRRSAATARELARRACALAVRGHSAYRRGAVVGRRSPPLSLAPLRAGPVPAAEWLAASRCRASERPDGDLSPTRLACRGARVSPWWSRRGACAGR